MNNMGNHSGTGEYSEQSTNILQINKHADICLPQTSNWVHSRTLRACRLALLDFERFENQPWQNCRETQNAMNKLC